MSNSIFKPVPIRGKNITQTLFNITPIANAVRELNNLLATIPLQQITVGEVRNIETRYGIQFSKDFQLNTEEFYATYLNHCLADKQLSPDEIQDLSYLKLLLALSDSTVDFLHNMVTGVIYKKAVQDAITDGRLSTEEKDFLAALQQQLKLPQEIADKIAKETSTVFLNTYVSQITSDKRLSPQEEAEAQQIANSLGLTYDPAKMNNEMVQRMRQYWALENLPLPAIQTDIILSARENCYIEIPRANWRELRTFTQESYTGTVRASQLSKRYAYGDFKRNVTQYEKIVIIDTGKLYLTNRRLVFIGKSQNFDLPLTSILQLSPLSNGIEIKRADSRNLGLEFNDKVDIFNIMLARVLQGDADENLSSVTTGRAVAN
ncbi:MAG TPA: hypothetical protein VK174_10200 [Chitinophagales bacterium]|nr:hypothetical protein [Chitinophagales bacterium]